MERQSRWVRGRNASRVSITDRDLTYLQFLFENGPTRSNAIHQAISPHATNQVTTERLKQLYRLPLALVDRPPQQREYYNANYSHTIYDINRKGVELLRDNGRATEVERLWRANRYARGAYRNFWHEVLVGHVMACVRLSLRDAGLRYISWYEILNRAPAATRALRRPLAVPLDLPDTKKLTPDGLFGVEYQDGNVRFFALEVDRATEPLTRTKHTRNSSFHRKLLAYEEVTKKALYKSHYGIPNFLLLTVTTSERHMHGMMKLFPGRSNFLFKTVTDHRAPQPSPELFSKPWHRSQLSDFNVMEV